MAKIFYLCLLATLLVSYRPAAATEGVSLRGRTSADQKQAGANHTAVEVGDSTSEFMASRSGRQLIAKECDRDVQSWFNFTNEIQPSPYNKVEFLKFFNKDVSTHLRSFSFLIRGGPWDPLDVSITLEPENSDVGHGFVLTYGASIPQPSSSCAGLVTNGSQSGAEVVINVHKDWNLHFESSVDIVQKDFGDFNKDNKCTVTLKTTSPAHLERVILESKTNSFKNSYSCTSGTECDVFTLPSESSQIDIDSHGVRTCVNA